MDFSFSAEEKQFQQEVREFLQRELPAEMVCDPDMSLLTMSEEDWQFWRGFDRKLAERGWLCMHWPKEFGGQSASIMKQLLFNEEMAYGGARVGCSMAINIVGPAIVVYGSDEQRRRYLTPITRAETVWCQGFSEPNAGSDLASLTTRAIEDGDSYVINGQKTWSSGANHADYCWLLARTDLEAPKHKGLSTFAVEMKTPGITVRPLMNMLGSAHFCEIFFEDVRVPKDSLVGEKNKGWYQAMATLNFERSGIGRVAGIRRFLDTLLQYVKEETDDNGIPLRRNPLVRQCMAELVAEVEVARLLCYRVAWMQSQGQTLRAEASVARVFGCELSQRVGAVAMEILGTRGWLGPRTEGAPLRGTIQQRYLGSIAHTLMAGTSEIQRNIIAERALELPKK